MNEKIAEYERIAAEMGGELKKNRKGTYYIEVLQKIECKECTHCHVMKVLLDFQQRLDRFAKKDNFCKKCRTSLKRKERVDNHAAVIERERRYFERNKQAKTERNRAYRIANKEKERERQRNWRENNRVKLALKSSKRRAVQSGLTNDLSFYQLSQIKSRFKHKCALTCKGDDVHMDHVIPVATGYGNTTLGNIIPLFGRLNESKCDSNIFVWFNANRERYSLEQDRFNALIEYLADINEMTIFEYTAYVYDCHNNPCEIIEEET